MTEYSKKINGSPHGLEETQYGFRWGPATVTRLAEIGGAVCIRIAGADGRYVNVYVSPQGRSVRVFRDGKEQTE